MTYTASTQGAQANCASVFMTSLNTLLVAAGFTYVEAWTTGAETANIFKSPSASNTQGADWFLNMHRTSDTTTAVYFTVSEVWDTGTKKLRNYAPSTGTYTPTGAFAVNDATGLSPNSSSMYRASVNISTAGFSYWLSATPNRVVLATRVGATGYALYAGLYDDFLPVAGSPFPLTVNPIQVASGGAATREPYTTTSTATCFQTTCGTYPFGLAYGAALDLYRASRIPGRALLYASRGSPASSASANGARGLLRNLAWCDITGSVVGDTLAVTDNAAAVKNYVCVNDGKFWAETI